MQCHNAIVRCDLMCFFISGKIMFLKYVAVSSLFSISELAPYKGTHIMTLKTWNIICFTRFKHGNKCRPRGVFVGWRMITTIFWQGKPLNCLPCMKNPILLMLVVGFEPTTPQSHSGGFYRVASSQGKVREKIIFSRSGKSQGISQKVREFCNYWKSHGKVGILYSWSGGSWQLSSCELEYNF